MILVAATPLVQGLFVWAAIVILLAALVALVTLLRAPHSSSTPGTAPSRILAVQLFGTAGTAVLLALQVAAANPALLDVALTLGLLAAVAVATFVLRSARGPGS